MKPKDIILEFIRFVVIIALLIGVMYLLKTPFIEDNPTDKEYVTAIVGEAANQTEDTMICVAHALRNRGNLHGVWGLTAKHIAKESKKTWKKAWVAWELSAHEPDNTHGAKNFGTYADLIKMDEVPDFHVQCGDLYFY